ncbi:MAG: aquaporin [Desulfamplus sp.]|nr:aquaporin [Desulfamplus sp.]MBF0388972.1 aquaporin [Desulfamplus sp.]
MNWTEYLCEFLGTFIQIFIGLIGIFLVSTINIGGVTKYMIIGSFFAIGLLVVVYSPIGKRSGAHLNPAVTAAFWLNKLMSNLDTVCYIIAQFAGASFAAWLVFLLFTWKDPLVTLTLPSNQYPLILSFIIEIVVVFVLIIMIFSFISSQNGGRFTGIAAAIYIILINLLFASISGASMNIARTFGTASILMMFDYLLVYLLASVIGTFAAFYLFSFATNGLKPTCSKLCYKTEGPCVFKCSCEYSQPVQIQKEPSEEIFG